MYLHIYIKRCLQYASVVIAMLVCTGMVTASEQKRLSVIAVTLEEAVKIAKQHKSGQVVKAEKLTNEKGLFYKIRLVDNGRVKDFFVDATSGALISK